MSDDFREDRAAALPLVEKLFARAIGNLIEMTYGQTVEFGYYVSESKVTMSDFHATILHLLDLDHERLTYRHADSDYRLTDVQGHVMREVLA